MGSSGIGGVKVVQWDGQTGTLITGEAGIVSKLGRRRYLQEHRYGNFSSSIVPLFPGHGCFDVQNSNQSPNPRGCYWSR